MMCLMGALIFGIQWVSPLKPFLTMKWGVVKWRGCGYLYRSPYKVVYLVSMAVIWFLCVAVSGHDQAIL